MAKSNVQSSASSVARLRASRLRLWTLDFGLWTLLSSTVIAAGGAPTTNNQGSVTNLRFEVSGATQQPVLRLRGADTRRQVIVTAQVDGGALLDYTRRVSYQATPAGIVQVGNAGLITPLADGTATVTAKT